MSKLKPFDLEAAKAGAKVVTRDGRQVRIICWDAKLKLNFSIVALVTMDNGDELTNRYNNDGNRLGGIGEEHPYDLFLLDESEPELTGFEKEYFRLYNEGYEDGRAGSRPLSDAVLKESAKELLELAKKELRLEVEAEYWGTQKPYFKGKEDGRAELLSNLPKWRKMKGACGCGDREIAITRTAPGYYYLAKGIGPGDTYIYLEDLEKLPWEE